MKNVNRPLSRRLILYMVLCSSAVTFVISAHQLYREYRIELEVINDALEQIREVHLNTVVKTVWAFDIENLQVLLEGISQSHDIEYVAVRDNNEVIVSVGEVKSTNYISESFPLIQNSGWGETEIGILEVVVDLNATYARIFDKAIYILFSNATKTAIVAGIMLLVIYQVVTRHLTTIAKYLGGIQAGLPKDLLVLDRKRDTATHKDELDFVVESINKSLSDIDAYLVEQKQSEQLLLEASQLNEKIIFEAPIGMSIYDSSGQCIMTNNAFAEIAGGTREMVMEQNYNNLASWKESGLYEVAKTSIERQEKVRGEFSMVTSFGREAIFDGFFMPFQTHDGQHLLFMLDDITERQKTAEELEKYQLHLERMVDERSKDLKQAQDELVLVIDTLNGYVYRVAINKLSDIGVKTEKPVYMTQGVKILTGYSADELLGQGGKSYPDLIHPDDFEMVLEKMKESVSDQEEFELNYRIQTRNGKERWVYERGRAIYDENDKPLYMDGYVIDDNARKSAEAELNNYRDHLENLVEERTKELKNAQDELVRQGRLATLGQLTATVSHELRNPLGAMRPALYLMKKKIGENADEKFQNAYDRIDRSIDRCDRIIDELLGFTRITKLDKNKIRLDEWLESVLDEQDIPPGILVKKDFYLKDQEVAIDPHRLRRAVINVVENAYQSMLKDENTREVSEASCLSIKTETNNNRIVIAVTDTGSGISEEVLLKIFEPLYSTKGFGVGLGMSVVKQIMEQHGGGVEINSEEGKGSTVTLWLPADAVAEVSEAVAI